MDLAGRQLQRAVVRGDAPSHARLRGRHPLLRGGQPPHRNGHRSRHRRDPVDLPRTADQAVGGLHAEGLREGSRLRPSERTRDDLPRHPRLLPARARPGHRAAHRVLRQGRRGRPARRPRALGAPPRGRPPPGGRLHHQLVPADRRERRGRGRQLPRAGLHPDPEGERAGEHPRVRRAHRKTPLDLQRDSAGGRVRERHLGERRVEVDRQRVGVGAPLRRPGARSRLCGDRPAADRLLRRLPPGRQPLLHKHPGARRADR